MITLPFIASIKSPTYIFFPDSSIMLPESSTLALAIWAMAYLSSIFSAICLSCSAFSIAGRREKGWGTEKKYSEDKKVKNVEDLFFEFFRIANDIHPKVSIGENVKSIMFGKAKEYFNRIINGFQDIGYTAVGKSLNAADYGTPQARERCFFVAVRNDILAKTKLNFMTLESVYPEPTNTEHVSLKEAINDIESDPKEIE